MDNEAIRKMKEATAYVTLLRLTDKDNKSFTVELYSKDAEEAYLKEKAKDKLFAEKEEVKSVDLIGTFKRVELKVIGE